MGVIIYPCKIQDKLSKMNSELEALMGKIVTASRVMEKIHTDINRFYNLIGYGVNIKKRGMTDIRMQEVCFRKCQN